MISNRKIYKNIEMLNTFKYISSNFIYITIFTITLMLTNSCGLYKKTDARNIPTSGMDRAKQNVNEGRGISLKAFSKGRAGTFQFSTSNPLWRATLETLDFLPFANLDYSGGMIITDWYADDENSNNSLKISVRFLSNEINASSLKIIVHERKCASQNRCTIKVLKSKIEEELVTTILQTASILKKNATKK